MTTIINNEQNFKCIIGNFFTTKNEYNNNINEYNSIKQAKIDEYITSLPSKQREVVKACLDAAKCKSSNGRRYTYNMLGLWMFANAYKISQTLSQNKKR